MIASSHLRLDAMASMIGEELVSLQLVVPLARIIRFSLGVYNNKRVRASGAFAMLAICVNDIDLAYLQKSAVNAHTHCGE